MKTFDREFEREERKIIEMVSNALSQQRKKEESFYKNLRAPQYSRPGYRIWWVLAPFLMIALALLILSLLPASPPTIDRIDSQIYSVEETLQLIEPDQQELASTNIDEEIWQIEEEFKTLKEEQNG